MDSNDIYSLSDNVRKAKKLEQKRKILDDNKKQTSGIQKERFQNIGEYDNKQYMEHEELNTEMTELDANLWRGRDSDSMKAVKSELLDLTALFKTKIGKISAKDIEKVSLKVAASYDKVILACFRYIDSHRNPYTDSGKARKQNVDNIMKKCQKESALFTMAMQKMYDWQQKQGEKNEDLIKATTLEDVLRIARTENDIKISERPDTGNNSDIVKIKQNGKVKWFKAFNAGIENYEAIVDHILVSEGMKNIEKGDLDDVYQDPVGLVDRNDRLEYLKNFKNDLDKMLKSVDEPLAGMFKSRVCRCLLCNEVKDWTAVQEYLKKDELKNIKGFKEKYTEFAQRYLIDEGEIKEFRESLVKDYDTLFISDDIASYNGIHSGANVVMRNVAASRIADTLGVGNLITRSELAFIENEEGQVQGGIIQENATGMQLGKFIQDKKLTSNFRVTPEAAKQLINLMMLDQISAQADRHGNNVFVDYEKKDGVVYITRFTGIDNDMCMGNLKKDVLIKGFNRIASAKGLDYINKDMYTRLCNLVGENGRCEQLRFELADCGISEEEFKALEDRLRYLKDTLHKRLNSKPPKTHFIDDTILEGFELTDLYNSRWKKGGLKAFKKAGYEGYDLIFSMTANNTGLNSVKIASIPG